MKGNLLITLILSISAQLIFAQNNWESYMDSGKDRFYSDDLKGSVDEFKKALMMADSAKEPEKRVLPLKYINGVYNKLGMYDSAIHYTFQHIETGLELKNDTILGDSYFNQGLNFKALSSYEKTKEYYSEALKIYEEIGVPEKLARVYNSLGNLERNSGRFQSSINYHKKALKIRVTLDNPYEVSKSYNNIGQTYLDSGLYEMARTFLFESIKLKKEKANSTATSTNLIGISFMLEENWDSASFFLNKALLQRKSEKNNAKLLTSFKALGQLNMKLQNFQIAQAYLDSAYKIARETEIYDELSEVLTLQIQVEKQLPLTYDIVEKYDELFQVDSLVSKRENQKHLMALNFEYDVIEYEKTIKEQIDQIRLEQAEKKTLRLRNFILSASVATFITVILIIIYSACKLRKSKKETEVKNKELAISNKRIENLHEELSHRTKNYYGMFRSIFMYDRKYLNDPKMKRLLTIYINRVEAMSHIQRYLQEKEVKSDEVQLDLYLSNLLQNIGNALNNKSEPVKILHEFETIHCDYDNAVRLALVMNEVVTNAFEHGFKAINEPTILLSLSEIKHQIVYLKISDNGVGIKGLNQFKQSSKGIGLMKMILKSNEGDIVYESENLKGTTVKVTLPKYRK